MNRFFNQTAFLLLMGYCVFNLFNVMWLKQDFPGLLIYWVGLCASFFVLRRLHSYATDGFSIPQPESLAATLVIITFAALIAQRMLIDGYVGEYDIDVTTKTFEFWGVSIMWLLVGGACSSFKIKENPAVALVILAIMALAFSRGLNDQLMISWADVNAEAGTTQMSHLGMELFVIVPLALAFSVSRKTQWLVALCGVFFLFSMGGRASLIMFVATVVTLALNRNPIRSIFVIIVVGIIGWFAAAYIATSANIDFDDRFVGEMLFRGGVEEDTSVQARLEFLVRNTANFGDQFLFGNPALFVRQNGGMGGYIHNILSAWEFYGFVSFITFIALLAYCYRRMAVSIKQSRTPIHIFGAFLLIYVIGSVIIAKSVLWVLLWFVLGFWLLKPTTRKRRSMRTRTPRMSRSSSRRSSSQLA